MTCEETALKDWLRLTRVLIGGGGELFDQHGHSRGWEWDARKEEMADDSEVSISHGERMTTMSKWGILIA